MLKDKRTTYYVKRYSKVNVYISTAEAKDLMANLTPTEFNFYVDIKNNVLKNPPAEYYLNNNLANTFNMTPKAMSNLKSSLKKKGYLVITTGKNVRKEVIAEVFIGKDQVSLYNLGIIAEIINAKHFKKLSEQFDIWETNITVDERKKRVNDLNQYYEEHINEFT